MSKVEPLVREVRISTADSEKVAVSLRVGESTRFSFEIADGLPGFFRGRPCQLDGGRVRCLGTPVVLAGRAPHRADGSSRGVHGGRPGQYPQPRSIGANSFPAIAKEKRDLFVPLLGRVHLEKVGCRWCHYRHGTHCGNRRGHRGSPRL